MQEKSLSILHEEEVRFAYTPPTTMWDHTEYVVVMGKKEKPVRFVQQLLLHFNLKDYSLSSRELRRVRDLSCDVELSFSERNGVFRNFIVYVTD